MPCLINGLLRDSRYSYARAFAIIAIVVLHTCNVSVGIFGEDDSTVSLIYNILQDLLMWAVPVFLMVTGSLLLDNNKQLSIKKIWLKYIARVFFCLIVFGFLYNLFDIITLDEAFTIKSLLNGFSEIYFGTSWGHLWYLYLIIGIYILLPFYKKIANQMSKKEYIYLFVVFLIFISIVGFLSNVDYKPAFYICVSSIYPCYLFVGNYIKLYAKTSKWAFVVFVLLTAIMVVFSFMRHSFHYEFFNYIFVYSSVFVFFQSFYLYKGIMSFKSSKPSLLNKIILKIDYCSFGMYLVHMFVIRFAVKSLHLDAVSNPDYFIIIVISACVISWLLTFVYKNIVKYCSSFWKHNICKA